jgi:uncharacterized protein
MTRVLAAALSILVVLGVLLALLWVGQRRLMYFPLRHVPSPAAVGLADVEEVTFTTADDVTLHGWFLPAEPSPPPFTVIVFNGNAGNRAYRGALGTALRARGLSVLLFDYRGFGENAGTPTAEGLAADGRAAHAYVSGRRDVDATRLVYLGESLGAAVAVELAVEQPPAALVLRSPFTSMADVGRVHYPLLPVHWLVRDRYATIDLIARVQAPLLVIAGSRDRIVPIEQSRRVYEAASTRKRFEVIEGADHNDQALNAGGEMVAAIAAFLQDTR